MDWGFEKVLDYTGAEYQVACFAICCHHCGTMFIEFFPNAKQENLFIGMIHAFQYMGIPEHVLTDNMKSVVLRHKGKHRFRVHGEHGLSKALEPANRNLILAA